MTDVRSLKQIASGRSPDDMEMEVERARKLSKERLVPKLLKFAGKIPFADDLAAAWYCALDDKTPTHVKAVLFAAAGYFVIPTDMIPDVIAGLGFTDDATVFATAMSIVGGAIGDSHKQKARQLLQKPDAEVEADAPDAQSGDTTNAR
ncbi:YkvA family protein [Ponticaulis sp.]|uniref:YkvA family protein n=1 Tax=Ponticaulis sp. TaxID=2020902 RepID=UPI000B66D3A6|nr:YkvA family protein [Ponticaulis sp.]MAI90982.1 hypothetical protein [Ponticaulis sp.]OUX98323.1 MAG: hypothetical protein CBB65_11095 [Hyphomonadaceae bacterium TMED5]